jgi:hypothetical protein
VENDEIVNYWLPKWEAGEWVPVRVIERYPDLKKLLTADKAIYSVNQDALKKHPNQS